VVRVAALCVDKKVHHTALFEAEFNPIFRDYLNLLIRPVPATFGNRDTAAFRAAA